MLTQKFDNLLGNPIINNLMNPNKSDNNFESSIQNDFQLLKSQNSIEKKTSESSEERFYNNTNENNKNINSNNLINFDPTINSGKSSSLESNYNTTKKPIPNQNNNLLNNNIMNQNKNQSKFEKMIQNTSDMRNSTLLTNPNQLSNTSIKWSNMVKRSKQEVLKLDLSQSEVLNATSQLDFSAMSENMEDLNDIIEENFQVVITENSFLRQESHSILPFLFLSSREIHRMCLSDYEIKLVNKAIKNKIKNNRLDWMDYYKKGLIKFYQAKYFDSFMSFKAAFNMRPKDKEVAKWLAFNILIIIFCTNNETSENSNFNLNDITNSILHFNLAGKGNSYEKNNGLSMNTTNNFYTNANYFYGTFKIDFSQMDKVNIKNEEYDYTRSTNVNENISDEEENPLFSCCSSRKVKIKSITVSSVVNTYQADKEQYKYNKIMLCKELESILSELLEKSNKENSFDFNDANLKENTFIVEIWWMFMIISLYVKVKPDQKAFTKYYDPKHCVKRIKDKDIYLGYLAYAEYNCLINKSFNPENIYAEIIYKYPKRIEAYLKFWNRLVKGSPKEYKKAHSLSEVFWKNSSIIQFDNDVY